MKKIIIGISSLLVISCSSDRSEQKQNEDGDSLKNSDAHSYRPGLGEFMSSIQMHHAKLWFAGINENWELAEFEIDEIRESIDDIKTYCSDRPEVKAIGIIAPAIDSLQKTINDKNLVAFKNNYSILTNTCNRCHESTEHAFNVVTIPTLPPVTNQDFKPQKK